MNKFTKKDGHPRFAHFAIFVFLIMATTFGLTKIGNYSLPDALAQTAGLVHYWNMDVDVPSGGLVVTPNFNGNNLAANGNSGVSLSPNGGKTGGSIKLDGTANGGVTLYDTSSTYPVNDSYFRSINPPWSFMAWVKLTSRSQSNGVYGTTDAPIFASQNMTDYCGLQVMIENATPTYKLIFDVMDCAGGTGAVRRKSVTSTIQVPHSNTTGLVASYPFNAETPSGILANDSSGFGNNGNAFGAPSFTVDRTGQTYSALSLNGSSQYVSVDDSNSLDLTTGLTISAWVKPNTVSSERAILSKWGITNGTVSYALSMNWQPPFNEFYLALDADGNPGGGYFTYSTNASIQSATWTHLAAVYIGNPSPSVNLYKDGVLLSKTSGTPPGSIAAGTAPLVIGSTGAKTWNGSLDEVKVFNRALNAAEIQALYQGDAQWAHVAVVAKGVPDVNNKNNVRLYINGEDKTDDTTSGVSGTATILPPLFPSRTDNNVITASLGTRMSGLGGYFNGYMDEVKIYNRALSSCEIKVSSGSSSSCPNGRCEQSCGENFLNCWADCKPKAFRDF